MSWPDHLLTLDEFEQLPEDNSRRYELQEGVLRVTPKAASLHQRVVGALVSVLNLQLPEAWEAVPDVEVVLAHTWPPTLRTPDVVITTTEVIDQNPNRLHASEVAVAVEVVSPGSHRTDRVMKAYEYAKAEIPFYWVVDLGSPVTLTANRLVEQGMYRTEFDDAGAFKTVDPFELHMDLDELVRRQRRP